MKVLALKADTLQLTWSIWLPWISPQNPKELKATKKSPSRQHQKGSSQAKKSSCNFAVELPHLALLCFRNRNVNQSERARGTIAYLLHTIFCIPWIVGIFLVGWLLGGVAIVLLERQKHTTQICFYDSQKRCFREGWHCTQEKRWWMRAQKLLDFRRNYFNLILSSFSGFCIFSLNSLGNLSF